MTRRSAKFRRAANKDLRKLAERAAADGWSAETLANGHARFTKPGRVPVVTGITEGDVRALANTRARLRRHDRLAEQAELEASDPKGA